MMWIPGSNSGSALVASAFNPWAILQMHILGIIYFIFGIWIYKDLPFL